MHAYLHVFYYKSHQSYLEFVSHPFQKGNSLWGANIVIYANHMLRAAYPAMMNVAKTILENERALEVRELCMPIKEILELIPGTK